MACLLLRQLINMLRTRPCYVKQNLSEITANTNIEMCKFCIDILVVTEVMQPCQSHVDAVQPCCQ